MQQSPDDTTSLRALVVPPLSALLLAGVLGGGAEIARADTGSTAAIAAGAAAIVGALLYDGSNHPYYVRNGHRYYVTSNEAQYYRGHHQGVERRAFVPEREYPISRDPYHGGNGARSQRDARQHDGGHIH